MSSIGIAEDAYLLTKFKALLSSPDPVALPRQTLLGAVSHYISSLPSAELQPLLKAVVRSPHLWDDPTDREDSRAAVKLGISGALDRLKSTPGPSRWFRRDNSLSDWLDEAYGTTAEAEGGGKLHVMVALLVVDPATGVEQGKAQLWKGKERAKAEDEVIMGAAGRLHEAEKGASGKEDVGLLCEVLEAVDGMRVRVLDTSAASRTILSSLYLRLADSPSSATGTPSRSSPEILSRAVARLFGVLDGGDDETRGQGWNEMRQFCVKMRGVISCLPLLSSTSSGAGGRHAPESTAFARQKTALFAFLVPSSTTLSILLQNDPPSGSTDRPHRTSPSADIASESLHTLSAFASILDLSQGGLEGYHRILHGMIDILVASAGPTGVKDLLTRAPAPDVASLAEGAWWMTFGESVINQVDQWGFETVLEPIIQRFISDNSHRSSFEAAHSLRLATLQAASKTLDTNRSDRILVQRDLLAYADLLIQQYTESLITSDQFRSAYPLIVEAASRHSPELVNTCLRQLRPAKAPTTSAEADAFGHSRRMVIIASAPHIPLHRLRSYLDGLAQDIVATPADSSHRVELAGAAFRMVMHDLPDGARREGMEWWTRWRGVFDSGARSVDAKL